MEVFSLGGCGLCAGVGSSVQLGRVWYVCRCGEQCSAWEGVVHVEVWGSNVQLGGCGSCGGVGEQYSAWEGVVRVEVWGSNVQLGGCGSCGGTGSSVQLGRVWFVWRYGGAGKVGRTCSGSCAHKCATIGKQFPHIGSGNCFALCVLLGSVWGCFHCRSLTQNVKRVGKASMFFSPPTPTCMSDAQQKWSQGWASHSVTRAVPRTRDIDRGPETKICMASEGQRPLHTSNTIPKKKNKNEGNAGCAGVWCAGVYSEKDNRNSYMCKQCLCGGSGVEWAWLVVEAGEW